MEATMQTTINNDTTSRERPEHVHGPQTFYSHRTPREALVTTSTEEVRDTVQSLSEVLQPEDHVRSLSHWTFAYPFQGGPSRSALRLLQPGGASEAFELTKNGYSQLVRQALPAHAGKTLDFLRAQGDHGSKVAGLAMNMGLRSSDEPVRARTVRYEDQRVVRSWASQKYAPVDHVDVLESILSTPELAQLPVVDCRITDTALRMRFLLEGDRLEKNVPTPMVEVWNSETGNRAVWLQGGIFKLWCLNGCGSWDKKGTYRWSHIGNPGRITDELGEAFTNVQVSALGTLDAYHRAMDVAIDDAFKWMEDTFGDNLTQPQMARVQDAMSHETTTPGNRLASVVDAVTLAAQGEANLYSQHDMEAQASRALRIGLGLNTRRIAVG